MKTLLSLLVAGSIAIASGSAYACGACIEDKVAATYDHAVVTKATAKGQVVVFGTFDGVPNLEITRDRMRAIAPQIKGVQRGTVQVSIAPPAFSFALDRRVQTPEGASAALARRLAMPGVRLSVIRVMR